MIERYDDFEISISEDYEDIIIDINGRPIAIILPQPVRISKTKLATLPTPPDTGNIQLADWGHELYSSVFQPQIETLFQAYLSRRKPSEGVRVCLDPRSNSWNAIPWELICSKLLPAWNYLALDPRTPVIRIPRIGQEVYLREIYPPLKILVLLASPKRIERIDAQKEKRSIQEVLSFKSGWPIQIDYLGFDDPNQAGFDAIQMHLASQDKPYDIVHVIGHGIQDEELEGAIAFVNPVDGKSQIVTASSLANLLRSQRVMLVILQSCQSAKIDPSSITFSSLAQQLVAAGIPAALAMQADIDQDIATQFFNRLYALWINKGCLFEEAITQARISIYQSLIDKSSTEIRIRSWAIPVLYICPGLQLRVKNELRESSTRPPSAQTGICQLDAALPSECQLGKGTELFVMVHPINTPGLREMILSRPTDFEPQPEDVRSSPPIYIDFPIHIKTREFVPVYLKLVIESEDFIIPQKQRNLKLHPQGDQVLCVFLITPHREGRGSVNIRLIDPRNDIDISNLVIKTSILPSVTSSPYSVVVSHELCPVCSTPVHIGAIFCDHCGYDLRYLIQAAPSAVASQTTLVQQPSGNVVAQPPYQPPAAPPYQPYVAPAAYPPPAPTPQPAYQPPVPPLSGQVLGPKPTRPLPPTPTVFLPTPPMLSLPKSRSPLVILIVYLIILGVICGVIIGLLFTLLR
jgi:hypothetical protein